MEGVQEYGWNVILGWAVLGALVSTVGSLLGLIIKDFFLARSLENWRDRRALEAIYRKYRDPLSLAALELSHRILEIFKSYPTVFLNEATLSSQPDRQIKNSIHDAYFKKYKAISTIYRFSAFLGWLELYRRELTFLRMKLDRESRAFWVAERSFRGDFADGHLNNADDWESWRDTLLFREEQRAIGEAMIQSGNGNPYVIGYAKFCELLSDSSPSAVKSWYKVSTNFWIDLEDSGLDFRKNRICRAYVHLVDMIEILNKDRVAGEMRAARDDFMKRPDLFPHDE